MSAEGPGRRSYPGIMRMSHPDLVMKPRSSLNLNARDSPPGLTGKYFPDPMSFNKMAFGSPSYPSPLDRIRSNLHPPAGEASFEGNQSFPKATKTKFDIPARKLNLDKFKGTDLNDVSFTGGYSKGSFNKSGERNPDHSPYDRGLHSSREISLNNSRDIIQLSREGSMSTSTGDKSMTDSWSFYNFIGGTDAGTAFPSTVRNPNKALCTINGKTSEILIANEMACELFGYEEAELIGLRLKDLVKLKPKEQATIMESHLEPCGKVVNLAGKVVEAVDKSGLILPVSMWVKKLDCNKQPRCLVVMEPVERSVAMVKFTAKGEIVSCDDQLAYIHGYAAPESLHGAHIRDLIPAIKLPTPGEKLSKDVKKQRATGRTKDGENFPLSIALEMVDDDDEEELVAIETMDIYKGVIWVFANISGLITFLPDGTIHSINENFSLMLFGYKASEVMGKNISLLIPDFYDILDLADSSLPLSHAQESSGQNGHFSTQSPDSGRCSKELLTQEDEGETRGRLRLDVDGFMLEGPGVTSTPNKPSVSETLSKRSLLSAIQNEAENHDVKTQNIPVSTSLIQNPTYKNSKTVTSPGQQKDTVTSPVSNSSSDKDTVTSPIISSGKDSETVFSSSTEKDSVSSPDSLKDKETHTPDSSNHKASVISPDSSNDKASIILPDPSHDKPTVVSLVSSEGIRSSSTNTENVVIVTDMPSSSIASSSNTTDKTTDIVKTTTKNEINDICSAINNTKIDGTKIVNGNENVMQKKEMNERSVKTNNDKLDNTNVEKHEVTEQVENEILPTDNKVKEKDGTVESATEESKNQSVSEKENLVKSNQPYSLRTSTPENLLESCRPHNKGILTPENLLESYTSHSNGASTPISKDIERVRTHDMTVSPCLSDIVTVDSAKSTPGGFDSSAVDGGDEMDDSSSSSGLNTTDELLAASMGLVKIHNNKNNSESPFIENKKNLSAYEIHRHLGSSCTQSKDCNIDEVDSVSKLGCDGRINAGGDARPSNISAQKKNEILNFLKNNNNVLDKSFDSPTRSTESSTDGVDDVDASTLHKTSIHQFLNSRCNRSRTFNDSSSFTRGNNSLNKGNNLSQSRPGLEVYYPEGIPSPVQSRNSVERYLDSRDGDLSGDYLSASLRSFEYHEKGVRYLTKPRNESKSSDYSSNGTVFFPEGSFQGHCQHRDKSLLGILFQIKRVLLEDGASVYCMWVSRDPEEPAECGRSYANLTLASSLNSTVDQSNYSLGEVLLDRANSASKEVLNEEEDSDLLSALPPRIETEEDRAINYGPYSKHYNTLHTIGKGAFGFVKLGQQKRDQTQVVVKFIRRARVFSDCWVQDEQHGRVPLEVSVLAKLDHPNIVKVLDVYQNAEFIQMVMEKHGSGMDLFEFIDRSPNMDEGLASFIFRQMVSAVSYLHNKDILHRDIKDENVIVNEQFQIKLIDFGAVAFLSKDHLFGTFCGTLEYCSPEVLMGNKYRGPELEVWSLGVTLYTLVFGENPFFDVDETIKCVLKPPFQVSSELMMLICWLLHPDPERRASVSSLEKNCWVQQKVNINKYKWHEVLPYSEFHGNTASDNRPDTPPTVNNKCSVRTDQADLDNLKCNLTEQLNQSDSDSSLCSN